MPRKKPKENNEQRGKFAGVNLTVAQTKMFEMLGQANLATPENLNLIVGLSEFMLDERNKQLPRLVKLKQLNQQTFAFLLNNAPAYIEAFCLILEYLEGKKLLNEPVLKQVLSHPFITELSLTIGTLVLAGLLNSDNLAAILSYKNPANAGGPAHIAQPTTNDFLSITASERMNLFSRPTPAAPRPETPEILLALPPLNSILFSFWSAKVLNQTNLNIILAHESLPGVKKVIEELDHAKIPLAPYLSQIIKKDQQALEALKEAVWRLKKENTFNNEMFDLAVKGYFENDNCEREKIKAVQYLMNQGLLTPLNLTFIDKGSFVHFGNTTEQRRDGWKDRAMVINGIYLNKIPAPLTSDTTRVPQISLPQLDSPVQSALNNLFNLNTFYFYKSPNALLRRELIFLQSRLYQAYTQFEQDNNTSQLVAAFKANIEESKATIEKTYTLTEQLTKLFNQLLNAVQSLVTRDKKDQRPWGRFFAHGERTLLVGDLMKAAENEPVRAEVRTEQTQEMLVLGN